MELSKSEKKCIRILFSNGPTSRKKLASLLNVTGAASTQITSRLIEKGYIKESGEVKENRAGRKELLLSLNDESLYFFGLDVKQNSLYLSITDFLGNKVYLERFEDYKLCINQIVSLKKKYQSNLGLCVLIRKYNTEENFKQNQPEIYNALCLLNMELYFVNNVLALGYLFDLFNYEKNNFLLIKYGPGLGSSIFIDGKPLIDKNGLSSEIGHTYIYNNNPLENEISFKSFFNQDLDERKGYNLILQNKDIQTKLIDHLSMAIINASSLLPLDNIVLSGLVLTNDDILANLKNKIKEYADKFDINKLMVYPNYDVINQLKASLTLFYINFCL